MRCKPLYLLILVAIIHFKCSESADSKGSRNGDFSFDEKDTVLEGSASPSSTIDDTENTKAKGIDDEDTLGVISGSGFNTDLSGKETVHISKPPKPTKKPKKPIFATKEEKIDTKPPSRPDHTYTDNINNNGIDFGQTDPILNNRIPEEPAKTDSGRPNRPIHKPEKDEEEEEEPEMVDNNNTSNEIGLMGRKTDDTQSPSFFAKPSILFAVIGGAVVGLLCAILLVMFIVYRMRKKDEGSYPLNEPRRSSNSYMRTSGKEFYA